MADDSRIDDLRRRVQKDPASIAFAQLAEECRRAGLYQEAADVCRTGLALHPAYLSARVTLGRALIELEGLDEAQTELEFVLKHAPENLAAIRGLAEIHNRRGSLPEALAQYRAALALARNDPDLERTVADLERVVEPPKKPDLADGLSFEQVQTEFLKHLPPPPPVPPTPALELGIENSEFGMEAGIPNSPFQIPDSIEPAAAPPALEDAPPLELGIENSEFGIRERILNAEFEIPDSLTVEDIAERERAEQTIAALAQWLDAIHVARTQPGA
jgi:tetratricopeptide (TPR) repeat protein